ncbi:MULTISPECIES: tRNA-dependent cyclodipeptide synthase [Streptomyces]|uniref:tRNA-dependent cyclodipeptide synthase n=1 Tax=Streptomyces TaxID=1883 RepID=UPI00069A0F9A|nr:tRNA-dependent cyclodipeptide synthase [Streptomyces sp. SID7805]MYU56034.1 tRNA-dependent cyclodipeptide synthase [Streptomyces sp. SID7805]
MQSYPLLTTPDSKMYVEPLSDRSRLIWQRGEHALIGVSAGNGYFNQDRLTALMEWAEDSFAKVDVVYVDTHIDSMLIADGRVPESAVRSVKATLKDVRRRIRRALERLGPEAARFRVRALSEIMELPIYRTVEKQTDRAIEEDEEFSSICETMVHEIVQHRPGGGSDVTAEQVHAGLSYLKAEAPLFVDSPSIFGVSTSVLLYHTRTPVSQHLAQQTTGFCAAQGQAYVVVRPPSLAASDT